MIEIAFIFMSSFVIAFSGAMMPGPLLTATISEVAGSGFWAGPLLILGHGVLEACLVVGLIMGLAPFFTNDSVVGGIGLVGAVLLILMAYSMFRSLPNLSLRLGGARVSLGSRRLVVAGAMISLANPYWTLWWATIGLGYVLNAGRLGLAGILSFFTGHILADLVFYAAVSMAVARGTKFMGDRLYRGVIAGCAGLLAIFACYFGYSGLVRLGLLT